MLHYAPLLIILTMIFVFGFLAWNGHKQQDKDAVVFLGIASFVFIALPLIVFTNGA